MKADCDLIMDGDTKPAGGREGRGTVGVWSVGVGKYSQNEIGVLWDGAWETPVHALINSLFLFFFELCFGCVKEGRGCVQRHCLPLAICVVTVGLLERAYRDRQCECD